MRSFPIFNFLWVSTSWHSFTRRYIVHRAVYGQIHTMLSSHWSHCVVRGVCYFYHPRQVGILIRGTPNSSPSLASQSLLSRVQTSASWVNKTLNCRSARELCTTVNTAVCLQENLHHESAPLEFVDKIHTSLPHHYLTKMVYLPPKHYQMYLSSQNMAIISKAKNYSSSFYQFSCNTSVQIQCRVQIF